MRHRLSGYRLSRDKDSRKALLLNLASSLLELGKITTTETKAKFARPFVEKLITDAKSNKLVANRKLASLVSGVAFKRLTKEIGPGFANRSGGYTRIVKLGIRRGDAAPTARLEILEWEKTIQIENKKAPKVKAKSKTSKGKKKTETNKKKKENK